MSAALDGSALLEQASLSYRLWRAGVTIDGDPFEPKFAAPLIELYDEPHPNVVIMKGAQLGVSAWAVLSIIDRMRSGLYGRGVLYGLPTQDEVFDFSQSRFARLLRDNEAFFAGAVRETDRTELKSIGGAMLYFRGVRQPDHSRRPSKLLSIPVDCLVLDERDDMDPSAVAIVRSRLDSSTVRHTIELGHPTFPEFGIAAAYEESDQRRWLIKCRGCSSWVCMEDEFPSCVGERDGTWFRCCPKCKGEIETHTGTWVAKYPGRAVRGYWMSQLLSSRKPVDVIVQQYQKACDTGRDEAAFWNLVMARPYADLDDALEREAALAMFSPDKPMKTSHIGPTFLGADVGGKTLHVWIGSAPDAGRHEYHWIGEVSTFDELKALGVAHKVQCGVIDAMAETRAVGDFIGKVPWAWGCRYDDVIRTDWDWGTNDRIVKVNRTAALDGSHRAIVDHRIMAHRRSQYAEQTVVPQLVNLVRVRQRNEKTGQERFVWHCRGAKNDHHRHAVAYAEVASSRVGVSLPAHRRNQTTAPLSWQAA